VSRYFFYPLVRLHIFGESGFKVEPDYVGLMKVENVRLFCIVFFIGIPVLKIICFLTKYFRFLHIVFKLEGSSLSIYIFHRSALKKHI